MRVMVIIKASRDSEGGVTPSEKMLTDMFAFNEELVKAGIMLGGEGLQPTAKAKRVRFSPREKRVVLDGPFSETKELVAGFWLWQVRSMDEAVEWVKRIPCDENDPDSDVEIRPVYELEDFGPAVTPEIREQNERLRVEVTRQK